MSSEVLEIERVLRSLRRPEIEEFQESIEKFFKEQLDFTQEFTVIIDRAERDAAEANGNETTRFAD